MSSNYWDDNTNTTTSSPPGKQRLVRNVLMALGAISLIGLGAGGVMWGIKQKPEWFGIKTRDSEQIAVQAETNKLVNEVGKLIELPNDETPTLAAVTDLDKIKDQNFFRNAKQGDKVLIYANSKKAYLYRPTDNKVIEVGVVNLPSPTGVVAGTQIEADGPSSSLSPSPKPINSPTQAPKVMSPTPTIEVPPGQ